MNFHYALFTFGGHVLSCMRDAFVRVCMQTSRQLIRRVCIVVSETVCSRVCVCARAIVGNRRNPSRASLRTIAEPRRNGVAPLPEHSQPVASLWLEKRCESGIRLPLRVARLSELGSVAVFASDWLSITPNPTCADFFGRHLCSCLCLLLCLRGKMVFGGKTR